MNGKAAEQQPRHRACNDTYVIHYDFSEIGKLRTLNQYQVLCKGAHPAGPHECLPLYYKTRSNPSGEGVPVSMPGSPRGRSANRGPTWPGPVPSPLLQGTQTPSWLHSL